MASVTYAVADGIGHIELNRPGAANVFDLSAAREFADAVDRAGVDRQVRVVLLTGAGRRFCAGGDVASFAAATDPAGYIYQLATELDAAFRTLAALEKPVVAGVHGAVAGAGLALMLSCDLIVAAPSTKFAFAYPGIGFTPDCGLSYLLPRAIGQQRALTFALNPQPLIAPDCLGWGLISEIAEDPQARARSLAESLANRAALALGNVRRLLRQGWEMSRVETGAEEARTITEMVKGAEAQRLISDFLSH